MKLRLLPLLLFFALSRWSCSIDISQAAQVTPIASGVSPSKFVFATGNGTPFSPRNIHRHFKLKLAEAGLPETTRIHDLRHSHISWLIRSGHDVKSVQAVAGHAQASTTIEIYSHLLPGYNREVANKIEGMFSVSE